MKLSIVIPAYNVAKYIDKCLSSLIDQDLLPTEYEIIVINDGSTDDTLSVACEFASKHSNIRVIDKQNEGLSMTRNVGLKHSVGDYILFVDSDDYIQRCSIAKICTKMQEEGLDIVEFGFNDVDEQGNAVASSFPYAPKREEGVVTSGRNYLLGSVVLYPMVWCRAYRRLFLLGNNLTMHPIRHEDEEFTPRALYLAQKVGYISDDIYKYVWHEGSIMSAYKESSFFDMITAMGNLHRFATTTIDKRDKVMLNFFDNRIATILLMIFKRSVRDGYSFQAQMVKLMTEFGIYPLRGKCCSFYVILFNLSVRYFTKYYQFKLRIKSKHGK